MCLGASLLTLLAATMSTFAWLTLVMGFLLLPGGGPFDFCVVLIVQNFFLNLDKNPHSVSFYLLDSVVFLPSGCLELFTATVAVSASL